MPIQQMLLGVGAVAKKTYADDCFSTYLYKGTGSSLSINNGIDVSGEGALVWLKSRSNSYGHKLTDTVRGSTKQLNSDAAAAQSTSSDFISGFTSTGFTLGTDVDINSSSHTYTSWTFRKTPGFFDVVTYTGNGNSNRQISHSLSSIPGLILIKDLSSANDWRVFHRGLNGGNNPAQKYLALNTNAAEDWGSNVFANTDPTATNFSVGDNSYVNNNGSNYVAYVFAGGESTAATARSVDFDGTGDYLQPASSSDFTMGTGDFTVECWVKPDNISNKGIFQVSSAGLDSTHGECSVSVNTQGIWKSWIDGTGYDHGIKATKGTWTHLALVRNSGKTRLYVDGIPSADVTHTTNMTGDIINIGGYYNTSYLWHGEISNFRVIKGTAVYTSSFRPPTEPLTNITNTKLLCCNNSSTTGSTVTPGTITANGDPTASTDSPFDDPAAHIFGESGSESVIKCGSFLGSGSAGLEVNLGFEPQWLLLKNASASENWYIFDSMRGIITGAVDAMLLADTNGAEGNVNRVDLTSTGFIMTDGNGDLNGSGNTIIYMALRRPDGYVGKPPELGTGVFAMDVGNGSTTIPAFDSGFPVDMNMNRKPASTWSWQLGTRLQGKDQLNPNTNDAEGGELAKYVWDSNAGFGADSGYDSSYQSWMWKRHAGFDVVTYKGDGVSGRQIPHSLNKTIEMMWVKSRDSSGNDADWQVYHSGLGPDDNDPEGWNLRLNTAQAQNWNNTGRWNKTVPTSTHFTLGNYDGVNKDDDNYIAMLFASVDGISKVGSFVIDGSQNAITVTTGFQPRFVIYKNIDTSYDWWTHDTVRGWGSGDDKALKLNSNTSNTEWDTGAPTSTGFTLVSGYTSGNYIYYAHA